MKIGLASVLRFHEIGYALDRKTSKIEIKKQTLLAVGIDRRLYSRLDRLLVLRISCLHVISWNHLDHVEMQIVFVVRQLVSLSRLVSIHIMAGHSRMSRRL